MTARLIPDTKFPCRPGWCEEHQDFGWLYRDFNSACIYALVAEITSPECRIVPVLALKKAKR